MCTTLFFNSPHQSLALAIILIYVVSIEYSCSQTKIPGAVQDDFFLVYSNTGNWYFFCTSTRTWWQSSVAKDNMQVCKRICRSQIRTNIEVSSLLGSFHDARRYYICYSGENNHLSFPAMNPGGTVMINFARYDPCWNGLIDVRVTI